MSDLETKPIPCERCGAKLWHVNVVDPKWVIIACSGCRRTILFHGDNAEIRVEK